MDTLRRPFPLSAQRAMAEDIGNEMGASPWGIGAVPLRRGRPTRYLAQEVTQHDVEQLNIEAGSRTSQQSLEALAMLVAVREWSACWRRSRSALRVRGDNMAMLAMVRDFKGCMQTLNALARDLALDFAAAAAYPSVLVEHIPGEANVWQDVLSRRCQPDKTWRLPTSLSKAAECKPAPRPRAWYRARVSPPSSPEAGARSELVGGVLVGPRRTLVHELFARSRPCFGRRDPAHNAQLACRSEWPDFVSVLPLVSCVCCMHPRVLLVPGVPGDLPRARLGFGRPDN